MQALADSEWVLSVTPESYLRLRCDLRALATIAAMHRELSDLYDKIADFDWTATDEFIRTVCVDPNLYDEFKRSLFTDVSFGAFRTLVTPQLLTFIERIAAVDDQTDSTTPTNRNPEKAPTLSQIVEWLFKIGAGWLEWAPDDVWSATPAEILLARDGWYEKQTTLHGKADKAETGKSTDGRKGLKKSDRDRLNALGDYTVKTMAKVPA